jgi:hypothetical protein
MTTANCPLICLYYTLILYLPCWITNFWQYQIQCIHSAELGDICIAMWHTSCQFNPVNERNLKTHGLRCHDNFRHFPLPNYCTAAPRFTTALTYSPLNTQLKHTGSWLGASGSVLCYKPEGRGFDSRWGHWIFQLS